MTQRHKAQLLILKLSERTTANGCTEAEAHAAETKIQHLMKTHKLRLRRPRRWSFFSFA
ncbi:MAG: DUF2786 domain-containing protein [Mesorhizobium sp.]|nr:MAG: DUF2786 domain-containing protein [Mesorhizobium sp.]